MTSQAGVYWVHRTSAKGDDSTDDSSTIQALIDAAHNDGGGVVYVQPNKTYRCNLTLKSGVQLVGANAVVRGDVVHGSVLKPFTAGPVIDTPSSGTNTGMAVRGLNLYGLGSGTACSGIRIRTGAYRMLVEDCTFANFADSAVQIDSGAVACYLEKLFADSCLLNTTRSAPIGVLDISGTDHWLSRIEATTSQAALSDSNAYLNAFAVHGSTCMFVQCIGEESDHGFFLEATNGFKNQFVACRADLNFHNGWQIEGDQNLFSSCLAYRNGQETDNTYSGFYFIQTTGHSNQLSSCWSGSLSSDSNHQKYGYESAYAGASNPNNQFFNCAGQVNDTALFSVVSNSVGDAVSFPNSRIVASDGDTTPSVDQRGVLDLTAYTTDTTITNFDDGVNGQRITVLGDANVTISHGTTIKTNTGSNVTLAANRVYPFILINGVWYME